MARYLCDVLLKLNCELWDAQAYYGPYLMYRCENVVFFCSYFSFSNCSFHLQNAEGGALNRRHQAGMNDKSHENAKINTQRQTNK